MRGPDFSDDAGDPDLAASTPSVTARTWPASSPATTPLPATRASRPARAWSASRPPAPTAHEPRRVLPGARLGAPQPQRNGLHIRVLNLSFGVDARRSYVREPLAYAAEQLWNRGIAVVASAGNKADGTGRLDLPAADPFLIAVGAADTQHTADPADDAVADFSSRDAVRPPDVVAPGTASISLRVPGSTLDEEFPAARVGDDVLPRQRHLAGRGGRLGPGRAAARGAPELTPDQIKALLRAGAVDPPPTSRPTARVASTSPARSRCETPSAADAAQPFQPAVLDLRALWADLLDESHGTAPRRRDGGERLDRPPLVGPRAGPGAAGRAGSWSGGDWGGDDGS